MREHNRKNTTVEYQIDGQFLTQSANAQGGKAVEEVQIDMILAIPTN